MKGYVRVVVGRVGMDQLARVHATRSICHNKLKEMGGKCENLSENGQKAENAAWKREPIGRTAPRSSLAAAWRRLRLSALADVWIGVTTRIHCSQELQGLHALDFYRCAMVCSVRNNIPTEERKNCVAATRRCYRNPKRDSGNVRNVTSQF
ncbi:hypothetical protein Y032_0003g1604 [Ancylostoma ceylanicum]|uniref:Uncharacterized protein n=1 Tax=Ancylostoma ceylanicum TaxID=53326 RepID=A0A016VYT1_9BILA|nr:hypothetical protein Y032_0003g1604 [Ancylostoma ceylanicum]